MKSNERNQSQGPDNDFTLWRTLDHTRFMISRLREKELDQFGITPEMAHILDILSHNNGSGNDSGLLEMAGNKMDIYGH
jgi:hypothetical protein